MSKVFYVTDKAIQKVFSIIEADPDYVFAETELTRLSVEGFERLKEMALLVWRQYEWEHDLFVSHLPRDVGTLRRLERRADGKYWAHPEDDNDLGRVEVTAKDLPHWVFDVSKFVNMIKEANGLSGTSEAITDTLYYVGTDSVNNTGVYIGLFDNDTDASAALSAIPKQNHDALFVICPVFSVAQKTLSQFKDKIKASTFADAFDADWKLRLGTQRRKKMVLNKYGYKSDHVLTFLDEKGPYRSYYVQIDNREKFRIPYSKFALLLFIAIKLKDNPQGWVSKDDTDSEEITKDLDINHLHAVVSELRELLRGQVKNPETFIETNKGRGTIRLSIPAANIKRPPDTRWMKRIFNAVKIEIEKVRKRKNN